MASHDDLLDRCMPSHLDHWSSWYRQVVCGTGLRHLERSRACDSQRTTSGLVCLTYVSPQVPGALASVTRKTLRVPNPRLACRGNLKSISRSPILHDEMPQQIIGGPTVPQEMPLFQDQASHSTQSLADDSEVLVSMRVVSATFPKVLPGAKVSFELRLGSQLLLTTCLEDSGGLRECRSLREMSSEAHDEDKIESCLVDPVTRGVTSISVSSLAHLKKVKARRLVPAGVQEAPLTVALTVTHE